MNGAVLLGEALDRLIERYGGGDYSAELASARTEFEQNRGRVFEEESLWEGWTQAFLEWFVVDRPLADGLSPAAVAYREERDPERAAAIAAWLGSQRMLAEVRHLSEGRVDIVDLLEGAHVQVAEQRVLHGVAAEDVVEVRVIGYRGDVYFGRTFCYHPTGTRPLLVDRVADLKGRGLSRAEILDACARLRVRCERYGHVAPARIYEAGVPVGAEPIAADG